MSAPKGARCRVDGCGTPGNRAVCMPGGDNGPSLFRRIPETELPPDDMDSYEECELFVCEQHAERLGWVDPDAPYVVIDIDKAEGWRLVVEFTSSPAVNPLVLYPPPTVVVSAPAEERL